MHPEDRDKFTERWLDSALKQRGEAEPAPGLEQRILSRLRDRSIAPEKEPWRWWPAFAALAAVVLLGALVLVMRNQRHEPTGVAGETAAPTRELPAVAQHIPQQQKAEKSAATKTPVHVQVKRRVASPASNREPRLEQFPSPQPLSEQEEMLAAYVSQFNSEAVLIARLQSEWRARDDEEWRKSGKDRRD